MLRFWIFQRHSTDNKWVPVPLKGFVPRLYSLAVVSKIKMPPPRRVGRLTCVFDSRPPWPPETISSVVWRLFHNPKTPNKVFKPFDGRQIHFESSISSDFHFQLREHAGKSRFLAIPQRMAPGTVKPTSEMALTHPKT